MTTIRQKPVVRRRDTLNRWLDQKVWANRGWVLGLLALVLNLTVSTFVPDTIISLVTTAIALPVAAYLCWFRRYP